MKSLFLYIPGTTILRESKFVLQEHVKESQKYARSKEKKDLKVF